MHLWLLNSCKASESFWRWNLGRHCWPDYSRNALTVFWRISGHRYCWCNVYEITLRSAFQVIKFRSFTTEVKFTHVIIDILNLTYPVICDPDIFLIVLDEAHKSDLSMNGKIWNYGSLKFLVTGYEREALMGKNER